MYWSVISAILLDTDKVPNHRPVQAICNKLKVPSRSGQGGSPAKGSASTSLTGWTGFFNGTSVWFGIWTSFNPFSFKAAIVQLGRRQTTAQLQKTYRP